MSDQWHYTRYGKQQPPVSPLELKKLASAGEISPDDLVWKEGMAEWAPARRLKGLFPTQAAAAVPPPFPPQATMTPGNEALPAIASDLPSKSASQVATIQQLTAGIHKQRLGIIAAATVGMLATFLPWIHAPIIGSLSGAAGDGWITLALFIPALVLTLRGDRTVPLLGSPRLGAAIPAGIASLIGLYKAIGFHAHMSNMPHDNPFAEAMSGATHIGIGLILLILSGLALIVIAWWLGKTPEEREQITSSAYPSMKRTNGSQTLSFGTIWKVGAAIGGLAIFIVLVGLSSG